MEIFYRDMTISEFQRKFPLEFSYDRTEAKQLGVNPSKLFIVSAGNAVVAKVAVIDRLYEDRRDVYIPAFNHRVVSSNGIQARLDAHVFVEEKINEILSLNNCVCACTDASPAVVMYWDLNTQYTKTGCESIEAMSLKSAFLLKRGTDEEQLWLFQ